MKRFVILASVGALLAGCGGSRPPAPPPVQAAAQMGPAPMIAAVQPAVVAPQPVGYSPQGPNYVPPQLTAAPQAPAYVPLTTTPGTVRVISPVQLTPNCQYLSAITESRYSGYLFAGNGLRKARNKVLASALEIGATHLVWDASNAGGVVQSASGSAYRCLA